MIPTFSHLHMGEVVQIGPWDWLQSIGKTKQMAIEQISVNLPQERINQVKDGSESVKERWVGVEMVGSWFSCHLSRSCFFLLLLL